uniref:Uncharacterized protein n=1 Tax=Caulobacter phage BL57 TaxID=3348355 RepID=A0AB74UIP7_9VIRU
MPANLLINPDGANFQAQAVLAMVRREIGEGLEETYDAQKDWQADYYVGRFENGREQGYAVSLVDRRPSLEGTRQINVVFYEGRSSDNIGLIVFERYCATRTLRIEDIPEDYWAEHTQYFGYGKVTEAALAVVAALKTFWNEGKPL